MFKIYKIAIYLLLISLPFPINAHVQHYENLKRIEFDIFRIRKNVAKRYK